MKIFSLRYPWIKIGVRIQFISTPDNPPPIKPGSVGTVTSITVPGLISGPPLGYYSLGVDWDDGSKLPVSLPTDTIEKANNDRQTS